jgi:DNA-binding SARP family transcriptional activator/tetratricopeptide (TPR) repeat protein
VDFTILGPTQLLVKGQPVTIGVAKQRALLTLLLANVGRPVPVETIMDQLWPGQMHDRIREHLYVGISRLRSSLARAERPCPLRLEGRAYVLDIDPVRIDHRCFREQVERGRRAAAEGDHVAARRRLTEALELWRGVPLRDLRSDWAARRRDQMEVHERLPAELALVDSELALREYSDALGRLGPLLDDHPLDEGLATRWLQALHGLGRVSQATAYGAAYRQRLLAESGDEPSPAFLAVFGAVLRNGAAPAAVVGTRPAPAPGWMIPRGSARLAGRDELMADLDRIFLWQDADLPAPTVALYGMPGVGKTSLALHWSNRRRGQFRGGLFLNFHGYRQGRPVTAEDAMAGILGQLGVPAERVPAGHDQKQAELTRLLGGRRTLLVLDNVRDSTQVRPLLLAAGSSCPVLITSRGQLDGLAVFEDLRVIHVLPLSTVDSVDILRSEMGPERADGDIDAVTAMAELAGGLPLVLKVIGQDVVSRPRNELADIVAGLGGRSGLVAYTSATDDPAATVHGAFASSVAALPAAASRLFLALGLHPEPSFGAQLVAALVGDDADQCLRMLVKANLIEPEGRRRYRMHDLVHAFASTAAGREESVGSVLGLMTRMFGWYHSTATNAARVIDPSSIIEGALPLPEKVKPLEFGSAQEAFDWCLQERDNLVSMVRCLADHGLHDMAWRIPCAIGEVVERAGHRDDFLDALTLALTSAGEVDDVEAEICLLNFLGGHYLGRQRVHEARMYFSSALALAERVGHPHGTVTSRHNLATAHMELGEIELAIDIYERLLRVDCEMGDRSGQAWTLHQLGSAYRCLGHFGPALRNYRAALEIRCEIGAVRGQGETLTGLGALHYQRGEYIEAADYCMRALGVQERDRDKVRASKTLTILAAIQHDAGRFDDAVANARKAVDLCQEVSDRQGTGHALHVLGHGFRCLGENVRAIETWSAALEVAAGQHAADVIRADLASMMNKLATESHETGCSKLRLHVIGV